MVCGNTACIVRTAPLNLAGNGKYGNLSGCYVSSKESYPIPKTNLNVFQESVVWIKE
jgi:hypothetical protein